MKKGKKILVVSILSVLCCIIAYMVWYQSPFSVHIEQNMYDDNGNPSLMQMDLTVRRSLLPNKEASLRGTVEFEGKRYESTSLYDSPSNYFFDINQLQEGGTYIDIMQNSLWLFSTQLSPDYSSFELLAMQQEENGEGKTWRSYIQNESRLS